MRRFQHLLSCSLLVANAVACGFVEDLIGGDDTEAPPAGAAVPSMAKLTFVRGDVTIRRGDAEAAKATKGAMVEPGDIVKTGPSARPGRTRSLRT